MKRLAIHILIVLILCGLFCDGYFTVSQLSCGRVWLSDSEVYAADGWEAVTQEDLVTAFHYYCKSRNLTIDGSISDALTSFTTTTFNNICNTLGIDVTSLQANLKKTVEGNLGLRFLMNQQGVLAYNRIFAEFLQNNDLAVGDQVDNKSLYSGDYFVDKNGNSSFVYLFTQIGALQTNNPLISKGSTYFYNGNNIQSLYNSGTTNIYLPALGESVKVSYIANLGSSSYAGTNLYSVKGSLIKFTNQLSDTYIGDIVIFKVQNDDKLYCGLWFPFYSSNNSAYYYNVVSFGNISDPDSTVEDADIYITTNNNTINNNNYNNNYTIIYNDGDTYITDDDDEPSPTTPPGGGGGGGDDPDQPSPSGPDLPDWNTPHGTGTIGSDGTFDFDIPFSLPDLNIDWSLKNIGNKFPFCIPSDIVSFYQVLAVEPEAPAIDAHIPLGSFYDWHFEADFSQYDNWARIIRFVEYVGFVITLIYFTVKLVKG